MHLKTKRAPLALTCERQRQSQQSPTCFPSPSAQQPQLIVHISRIAHWRQLGQVASRTCLPSSPRGCSTAATPSLRRLLQRMLLLFVKAPKAIEPSVRVLLTWTPLRTARVSLARRKRVSASYQVVRARVHSARMSRLQSRTNGSYGEVVRNLQNRRSQTCAAYVSLCRGSAPLHLVVTDVCAACAAFKLFERTGAARFAALLLGVYCASWIPDKLRHRVAEHKLSSCTYGGGPAV
jgi:hypothetical protein